MPFSTGIPCVISTRLRKPAIDFATMIFLSDSSDTARCRCDKAAIYLATKNIRRNRSINPPLHRIILLRGRFRTMKGLITIYLVDSGTFVVIHFPCFVVSIIQVVE